ncbi:MAG: PP0621 family protein [Sedimenticola sp.]
MKLLFILVAALLIYYIIQLISKSAANQTSRKKSDTASVETVQCRHCGVYLPRAEAVSSNDNFYCGPKHLEADKQTRDS